uniref:Uncharacterized protein n=1 Tax=Spongospora subterranea TaxID=70186 RepID=A0A0H5QKE0_9EUKA|eukprot:CRZ02087.1 hypothetical protein [Spongospora subterranea]
MWAIFQYARSACPIIKLSFGASGCPYNVDGTSGVVQYCSKWGFCGTDSTFKAQQTAGHYIYSSSLDGSVASTDVCTTRPDPGAFCNAIAASATCSLSDTRCELFNVQASDFDARGDYSKAVVRCGPFFGDYVSQFILQLSRGDRVRFANAMCFHHRSMCL